MPLPPSEMLADQGLLFTNAKINVAGKVEGNLKLVNTWYEIECAKSLAAGLWDGFHPRAIAPCLLTHIHNVISAKAGI